MVSEFAGGLAWVEGVQQEMKKPAFAGFL